MRIRQLLKFPMTKHDSPQCIRFSSARLRLIGTWILTLTLALCGGAFAELAEKVAEEMKHSTVRVAILADGEVKGHGSGFIISSQGHVATNRHVIAEADDAVILYCEGDRVYLRPAELVAVSSTADLAILKIDPIPSTEVVEIATSELAAGQTVMTVGFPGAVDSGTWATLEGVDISGKKGEGRITSPEARGDFEPAVFPGAVAKNVTDSGTRLVLHSAKISGGNSGGPLIDADGRVCGINTALVPAAMAGADYPISIHVAELVSLARLHGIRLDVTSSRASNGSVSGLHLLLYIVLAAFAVVMFLMVLRKPRTVMVDAMSRVVRSRKHDAVPAVHRSAHPATIPATPRTPPSMNGGGMRLRGRDLHGLSYDIPFTQSDFQRGGGRLVIGRNNDLSQLLLSHDSVSRQHATLTLANGSVQVEDRNSGNGTRINGQELPVGSPPVPLRPGDKLTLGEVDLMFEVFN